MLAEFIVNFQKNCFKQLETTPTSALSSILMAGNLSMPKLLKYYALSSSQSKPRKTRIILLR